VQSAFDPEAAARFIADAHRLRAPYQNLPPEIAPKSVSEAYAAQDQLRELWVPLYGRVAGLKIATTTKVMQQMMGIDRPCAGMIFERRVHHTPAKLSLADYINLMIECELAVRLSKSLPQRKAPYSAAEVRAAVGEGMPAFELIEDRKAHYKSTSALSLIVDNAWNAGVVLGLPVQAPATLELNGLEGRLIVNNSAKGDGRTDDPMGALAWLANLAAERGRPLEAGMVVITGSIIPTVPIAAGERFVFEIEDLGRTELTA
jgi:2-keto-4-pentenoate hydratase